MSMPVQELKTCFFIAPIGPVGSDTRIRSDQVYRFIVSPALAECGYSVVRADQLAEPGMIAPLVIQHIVNDPLVIADLTDHNPNVFYELAIRHVVKKPVIQIMCGEALIPFDIAGSRTIQFDHHDLESANEAREDIVRQIRAAEANPKDVTSPISIAVDLQYLRVSDNPLENSSAELLTRLQEMRLETSNAFQEMRTAISEVRTGKMSSELAYEIAMLLAQLHTLLESDSGQEVVTEQHIELWQYLRHSERLLRDLCHVIALPYDVMMRRLRPKDQ